MLKEIERILKNCKLREEQVKELMSLRFRYYLNNLIQIYFPQMITVTRLFETHIDSAEKTTKLIQIDKGDETLKTGKWRPQDDEKTSNLL